MLHVAFFELARGRSQYLLAGNLRLCVNERAHVLQLVSKPVSAARLIEGGPRPHTARKRLVEQPAIQHYVHRRVRRFDFYRLQQVIPIVFDLLDRLLCYGDLLVLRRQSACFCKVLAFAEDHHDFALFAWKHLDNCLHRRAGIKSRADPPRELHTAERCGIRVRSVTAQELFAVASDGAVRFADVRERHSMSELVVVRIAGEDRSRVAIQFGDDQWGHTAALGSKHPFGVACNGDSSLSFCFISETQERNFYRSIYWAERQKFLIDPVTRMLKDRISLPVFDQIPFALAYGRRRGRPHFASVLIPQVNRFAGRITDGIV